MAGAREQQEEGSARGDETAEASFALRVGEGESGNGEKEVTRVGLRDVILPPNLGLRSTSQQYILQVFTFEKARANHDHMKETSLLPDQLRRDLWPTYGAQICSPGLPLRSAENIQSLGPSCNQQETYQHRQAILHRLNLRC